jgi:hypothetical protein
MIWDKRVPEFAKKVIVLPNPVEEHIAESCWQTCKLQDLSGEAADLRFVAWEEDQLGEIREMEILSRDRALE